MAPDRLELARQVYPQLDSEQKQVYMYMRDLWGSWSASAFPVTRSVPVSDTFAACLGHCEPSCPQACRRTPEPEGRMYDSWQNSDHQHDDADRVDGCLHASAAPYVERARWERTSRTVAGHSLAHEQHDDDQRRHERRGARSAQISRDIWNIYIREHMK